MAVTVLRTDGWMPQAAALDLALLMYIRYVCTDAYVLSRLYRSINVSRHLLSQPCLQSDEKTSDGLDGQDTSRPLSVDGETVPGGEQTPTQGSPPRRSDPGLSAVREGDLSDLLHRQDDQGTGVPSVQGPR